MSIKKLEVNDGDILLLKGFACEEVREIVNSFKDKKGVIGVCLSNDQDIAVIQDRIVKFLKDLYKNGDFYLSAIEMDRNPRSPYTGCYFEEELISILEVLNIL